MEAVKSITLTSVNGWEIQSTLLKVSTSAMIPNVIQPMINFRISKTPLLSWMQHNNWWVKVTSLRNLSKKSDNSGKPLEKLLETSMRIMIHISKKRSYNFSWNIGAFQYQMSKPIRYSNTLIRTRITWSHTKILSCRLVTRSFQKRAYTSVKTKSRTSDKQFAIKRDVGKHAKAPNHTVRPIWNWTCRK